MPITINYFAKFLILILILIDQYILILILIN